MGAANSLMKSADLIVREVLVNGVPAKGLIDSGSTRTIIGPGFTINVKNGLPCGSAFIVGFGGSEVKVQGESVVRLKLAGKTIEPPVLHSRSMLDGVDLIVGLDVLRHHKLTLDKGRASVVAAAAEASSIKDN